MSTSPKKASSVSQGLAVILGIGIFALDVFFVIHTISGLMAGKVRTLGKGAHSLVIRDDDPSMFWFQISGHFFVEFLFAVGALGLLAFGFRQLKR